MYGSGGASAPDYGYAHGGDSGPGATVAQLNEIQRYAFSSDGNAADVGDLTEGKGMVGGTQN